MDSAVSSWCPWQIRHAAQAAQRDLSIVQAAQGHVARIKAAVKELKSTVGVRKRERNSIDDLLGKL